MRSVTERSGCRERSWLDGRICIGLAILFACAQPGTAAVFNIANEDVAGLIAAITTANGNSQANTINLAAGGMYTLTAVDNSGYWGPVGLPVIVSPITINGNASTIRRSAAAGTPDFRIFIISNGPSNLMLNGVTISGGRGGGWPGAGILSTGHLSLTNSTVSRNIGVNGDGGGIFNYCGTLSTLNSTISQNTTLSGYGGGGILNFSSYCLATATIVNTTIFENKADGPVGGQGRGDAIADEFSPAGSVTLKNSIAASTAQGLDTVCYGSLPASSGYNIIGDTSCALTGSGDLNGINPLLGPLTFNSSPALTNAPQPTSPAIDAVPLANCTDAAGNAIATDQRGFARPSGAACDAGSVELTGGMVVTWGRDILQGWFVPNGLTDVVAVAGGGGSHSLALTRKGQVTAWGNTGYDQAIVPAALAGARAIAAGDFFSLGVNSAGKVVAWGFFAQGQITVPDGLTDVVAVAAGYYHGVALTSKGKVVAWGANNNPLLPATVPPDLPIVVAIAAGGNHTLVLTSEGKVMGWGNDQSGQVSGAAALTDVVAISAGDNHSVALKSDGTMVAFGNYGAGAINAEAITGGSNHILALKSDGTVLGWGDNQYGQTTTPATLTGVIAIAAGPTSDSSYAITLTPTPVAAVTITTSPAGQSFTVDSVSYTAPNTFNWVPGSSHSVGTTSPQVSGGTRYVYSGWSDGGGISHTITAPSSSATWTAGFTTQYLLTVLAGTGGTVSGGGWYDSGTNAPVTATPNPGYTFSSWTGDLTSGSATGTVSMTGPRTVTGNFIVFNPVTAMPGLTFLNQGLGSPTAQKLITVKNMQTGPTGLSFSLTGANAADFLIEPTSTTCGANLAGNGTCKIAIRFDPTAPVPPAARFAMLTFSNTSNFTQPSVSLTGTAVQPMTVSPPALGFGTHPLTYPPVTKTVIVKSNISSTITSFTLSVNGVNPGDFTPGTTTCTNLAAHGICSINIVFKPLAPGPRKATLMIYSSAANSPLAVTLKGN